MTVAVTMTTIHEPRVLEDFAANVKHHGHREVTFLIVGDRKTPDAVGAYCQALARRVGLPVRYYDAAQQADYLKRFPALDAYLPYNSFARRNVADLMAYEEGFDIIIRIDDDNFPTDDDFIGLHQDLGGTVELTRVAADSGWYNICETLEEAQGLAFYPRGYPYSKRWMAQTVRTTRGPTRPALNAGLWLGDPDVDAVTRLHRPVDAVRYRDDFGARFALEPGTWCPINTQNTAYHRRLMPAAFVPPHVGRYDDIWSGYLLRKLMDHFGDHVTYGRPLLKQIRNAHNLWRDLDAELNGNQNTDPLIEALRAITITGVDYTAAFAELADQLDDRLIGNREVFDGVLAGMRVWAESVAQVQ